MNAPNANPLCKQAELHFYDFLDAESHRRIPLQLLHHIEHCEQCLENISQLKQVLTGSENQPDSQLHNKLSSIRDVLNLHFAYIGKPVTCNIASPFLPMMLEPLFDVKVPTPITAHLNICQQCSDDLKTIKGLGLKHSQLCRLSRLLAEKPAEPGSFCSKAHSAVLAVLEMNFKKTSPETLKHLSLCADCRKLLYKYRQAALKNNLERDVVRSFPCREVTNSDIFDYVVPYGIEPSDDQYANFREPLTSHLRTCSSCLAKIQRLHCTIYAIAEREQSGVATIYHVDESAEVRASGNSEELYKGYPVRVEVLQQGDQIVDGSAVQSVEFDAAKRKTKISNAGRFLRSGAAAAAVLLIAASFLMTIPSASGVSISQLYKALEKVKNVYIASFIPGKDGPVQEQWLSRTYMVRSIKTEDQHILWDSRNGTRKIMSADSGLIETFPLSEQTAADVGKTIEGSLGLVPFADLSLVPKNAKWSRVTGDILESPADGIEIYDLTWSEKNYDGSLTHKKWRFYLSSDLTLPRKVQLFRKSDGDVEYNLLSTMTVEYLDDTQIRNKINEQ